MYRKQSDLTNTYHFPLDALNADARRIRSHRIHVRAENDQVSARDGKMDSKFHSQIMPVIIRIENRTSAVLLVGIG